MRSPILAVTGDTHGEKRRFINKSGPSFKYLRENDYLFVCGDFGFIFCGSDEEQKFLKDMADKLPYTICFCDGNHENFDLINSYEVSVWNGGKVHIIKQNKAGEPKVIHLMRGQVYEIEGNRIFSFGGAYSIDKAFRTPGKSWWPQEMQRKKI